AETGSAGPRRTPAAPPIATENSRRCSFASSKLSPCWVNHSRCIVSVALNANAMGGVYDRLVTRGRLSQSYAKGFLTAPEDREPAVRKLIEAAGGKLINFYFTTGDSDFLLISEADDAENIIAALMAAAAAGTISDVTTARAWTGAEFKAIGDKPSKAAKASRVPGKR